MCGAAIASAWAAWFAGKKLLRRMVRALHLSDRAHDFFGVDPVTAINQRFNGLELRMSRAEIVGELKSSHYRFAVYICDRNGACTFVNSALCRLFKLSQEEALGHGWSRALLPEEKERIIVQWERAIQLRIPYEARYTIHGVRCITRAVPLIISGEIAEFIGYVVPE